VALPRSEASAEDGGSVRISIASGRWSPEIFDGPQNFAAIKAR